MAEVEARCAPARALMVDFVRLEHTCLFVHYLSQGRRLGGGVCRLVLIIVNFGRAGLGVLSAVEGGRCHGIAGEAGVGGVATLGLQLLHLSVFLIDLLLKLLDFLLHLLELRARISVCRAFTLLAGDI